MVCVIFGLNTYKYVILKFFFSKNIENVMREDLKDFFS